MPTGTRPPRDGAGTGERRERTGIGPDAEAEITPANNPRPATAGRGDYDRTASNERNGMSIEIENATIKSTTLGIEDHGIWTAYLQLEFRGCVSQGFGGYRLDGKSGTPSGAMSVFVMGVCAAIGVREWEALRGQHCRIRREGGRIVEIGHIIEDKWFNPEKAFETFAQKGTG